MPTSLAYAAAAAIIATTVAAPASAAPISFTFDPTAVPLAGSAPFTGTNVNVLDFARVDLGATTGGNTAFTQSGFLQFNNISNADATPSRPDGLNDTYSLYLQFSGVGTQNATSFASSSIGTFTSLNYTIYGVDGVSTFSTSGGTPSVTNQGTPVTIATGSLVSGGTSLNVLGTNPNGLPQISPGASVIETVNKAIPGFFVDPVNMTLQLAGAFTNDVNSANVINAGQSFILNNGGGVVTFTAQASPVPEPMSLALLGTGLVGVGLLRRRKHA